MAKKTKLVTDKFDVDPDLNFDFSDMDVQEVRSKVSPQASNKNSRSPIQETFRGTINAARSRFKETYFINKVVKESLPSQYGEVIDTVDTVAGSLSTLYDSAFKEIKPQLSRLTKKIDKLVPEDKKLAKKISSKIKDLVGDEVSTPLSSNNERFKEQSIANSISAIFQNQEKLEKATNQRREIENQIKEVLENKRFSNTFSILSSIDNSSARVASYTENVTQAYQKKSLELQFRSLFVQSELLEASKRNFEIFKIQNDSIVKNTALPEFVKISNSEKFREVTTGKFFEGLQNSLFNNNTVLNTFLDNLKAKTKETVDSFKTGLESAIDGLNSVDDIREQNELLKELGEKPISGAEMFGSIIGGGVADFAGDKISAFARSKIKKDSAINKFGYKAANFNRNLSGSIRGLKNSKFIRDNEFSDGLKGVAANLASSGLDLFENKGPDLSFKNTQNNLTNLNAPAIFDNKIYKSVSEIIPGYLARIHREIIVSRTNDESTPLTLFDHKSSVFKQANTISKDLKDTLQRKIARSFHKNTIDKEFENIVGDRNASPEQARDIKRFFSNVSTLDMEFTPENITNTGLFKMLNTGTAKIITDSLNDKAKGDGVPEKGQYDITNSFMKIKNQMPDIRSEIELFINAGYGDLLEEEGFITRDEAGGFKINLEKYKDLVNETNINKETTIKSDINAKRKISRTKPLTPKASLRAVNRTPLFEWFYRKGQGDQKAHFGPMAQSVKQNMGEDTAPDGKEIDLTNMNGFLMNSIQEIYKIQENISKGGDTLLKGIKEDTTSIVALMSGNVKRGSKLFKDLSNRKSTTGNKDNDENMSYKDILVNLLKNSIDSVSKIGGKIFSRASEVGGSAKSGFIDPVRKLLSKLYTNNKDKGVSVFETLFAKAGEMATSVLDVSRDVLFNKLPAGYKELSKLAVIAKNRLKEMLEGPIDIYLLGMTTPAIKANLLKVGYYFDQATGKVISSLEDIKGPVVDKLGNVVLTIQDIANGLYDSKGKNLLTRGSKILDAVLKYGAEGFDRLKTFSANLFNGSSIKDKLKGIFTPGQSSSISNDKSYQVLVDIRNILSVATGIKPFTRQVNTEETMSNSNVPESEPRYDQDGNVVDNVLNKASDFINRKKEEKKQAFNDRDNSGKRDGSWEDRLKEQLKNRSERTEKRNADREKPKARYKSDNFLDSLLSKATGLFSMLSSGASTLLGAAGGILSTISKGSGLLGTVASTVLGLGKGAAGIAGKVGGGILGAAGTVAKATGLGRFAGIASFAKNALLAGSILTTGTGGAILSAVTTGLVALGSVLTSPVALGALAVSAAAYGAYRGYKYLIKDNLDEYQDIRIKQYGLTNAGDDKQYNSKILELENYLLEDGIVGYVRNEAMLLPKKLDPKIILNIMSIDEGDKKQIDSFQQWFNGRFKPFFLTHCTALYSINNKTRLNNVASLDSTSKLRYLELIGYEDGPYDVLTSPFKGKAYLSDTKAITKESLDVLLTKLTKEKVKSNKDKKPVIDINKNRISEVPPVVSKQEDTIFTKNNFKPKTHTDLKMGEEGDYRNISSKVANMLSTKNASIKQATGSIMDGSAAGQYINLAPGVTLDGINASLLNNLKGMIEEYGSSTGKSVTITSGYRSSAQQEQLHRRNPKRAAKPGSSMHEFGLAIDLDSKALDEMDKLGLMRKYGFTRPVGGEPWHTEAAGIQANLSASKKDNNLASQLIEASINRGGGGIGSIKGSQLGRRDSAYALGLMDIDATKIATAGNKNKGLSLVSSNDRPVESDRDQPQLSVVSNNTSDSRRPAFGGGYTGSINTSIMSGDPTREALRNEPEVSPGRSEYANQDSNLNTGQVKTAISNAAGRTGVNPIVMQGFAAVESDLNPYAKAPNTNATGLYQFVPKTWNEMINKKGSQYGIPDNTSPTNIKASTLMASEYIKANSRTLGSSKQDINITDIYLAHFLGPSGARKFLRMLKSNPNAIAAQVVAYAAKKNKNLFFNNGRALTVREFYDNISSLLQRKARAHGIDLPVVSSSSGSSSTREDTGGVTGAIGNGNDEMVQNNANVPTRERPRTFEPQPIPGVYRDTTSRRSEGPSGYNLDQDFTTINDTLNQQLAIQTQILEVIKNMNSFKASPATDKTLVAENKAKEEVSAKSLTSAINLKRANG